METPARYTFAPDGSTKTFPIPALIKGDNYVRIDVDSVTINDRNKYDIVNNAIVFVDVADVPNGSQLDVLVVQTDEGITNLGAVISVDIVAQNITSVNTVASDIASVNTTAANIATINTVNANITAINNAVQSATDAAASEAAAAASASAASNSQTAAASSATTASGYASSAATSLTNATAAELAAIQASADADTAKNAAQTSETNAANSAWTASTNASSASSSASSAAASAATATTKASEATAAANAAEAAWDSFDDRYLGSKSAAPSLDNDGNPLLEGAIYWNSGGNALQIYNGSSWENIATLSSDPSFNSVSALDFFVDTNTGMVLAAPNEVGIITGNVERVRVSSTGVSITGSAVATTGTNATATGSVTLDFNANQNFVLTLTGNVTLANPTTEKVGQSGFIVLVQDATGGRTVSLSTDYETAGGSGLTLSTSAGSTDIVPYIVMASGRILLGAPQLNFS